MTRASLACCALQNAWANSMLARAASGNNLPRKSQGRGWQGSCNCIRSGHAHVKIKLMKGAAQQSKRTSACDLYLRKRSGLYTKAVLILGVGGGTCIASSAFVYSSWAISCGVLPGQSAKAKCYKNTVREAKALRGVLGGQGNTPFT
jgi:hypothetical protein